VEAFGALRFFPWIASGEALAMTGTVLFAGLPSRFVARNDMYGSPAGLLLD
jgi:hypothetical protein